MKVSVQPEDHNGYDCEWEECEVSDDNWREELQEATNLSISNTREKYSGLHIYFECGRKAIAKDFWLDNSRD